MDDSILGAEEGNICSVGVSEVDKNNAGDSRA